ncbi:MAG: ParB/RepB/Spo0J family partition protein [Candidatus Nomurabacteria bacterium]|jgi:ParB family chromosome partitioning protein|nr:ParB/RepB/Spo0J family partition protein [Candidatus Nomurabacteria bacterium]
MSVKKGLGRSFESLIPTELIDETFDPTVKEDRATSSLIDLPLSSVEPDESQPRRHFDERALGELANSIKEFGVLQPIVVVRNGVKYIIVAGERRYRASKLAGVKTIPAIVRTLTNQRRLEVSLIENVHRKDLNVLEVATTYVKLRDQFNLTAEQISQRVGGRSASAISNTIRLLKLPASVKQAIVDGNLSEGQARPLINVETSIVDEILPKIIAESWSARKIEQFVVGLKMAKTTGKKTAEQPSQYADEIKKIQESIGLPTAVRTNARGAGQLTIKFKNDAEFRALNKKLAG